MDELLYKSVQSNLPLKKQEYYHLRLCEFTGASECLYYYDRVIE